MMDPQSGVSPDMDSSSTVISQILEWEYALILLFVAVFLVLVVISGVAGSIAKWREDSRKPTYSFWDYPHPGQYRENKHDRFTP